MKKKPTTPRKIKSLPSPPKPDPIPTEIDIEKRRLTQERDLERRWLTLEQDRLNLERARVEFIQDEAVARLAIELGRNGPGRGGNHFIPNVTVAARLLSDASQARANEKERLKPETPEDMATRLQRESDQLHNPPLRWHPAKHGAENGSGGVLTWPVLCKAGSGKDQRITVGVYELKDVAADSDRGTWKETVWRKIPAGPVGTWEVLQDERLGWEIIKLAIKMQWQESLEWVNSPEGLKQQKEQKFLIPTELKPREVTELDIYTVISSPGISEAFFRLLVKARSEIPMPIKRRTGAGGTQSPRNKKNVE